MVYVNCHIKENIEEKHIKVKSVCVCVCSVMSDSLRHGL